MSRASDKGPKILAYIREYTRKNGYPPSVREIGAAVGLASTASVQYHLDRLKKEGVLAGGDSRNRALSLPDLQTVAQIPVLGVVTAGLPILAVENIEGYIPWQGEQDCFALRVKGDSMKNAGILPGDLVIVRAQSTAEDHQIVVALLGDEATVKRLSLRDGEIRLLPENDAYAPIDGTDAVILGAVKAVYREY